MNARVAGVALACAAGINCADHRDAADDAGDGSDIGEGGDECQTAFNAVSCEASACPPLRLESASDSALNCFVDALISQDTETTLEASWQDGQIEDSIKVRLLGFGDALVYRSALQGNPDGPGIDHVGGSWSLELCQLRPVEFFEACQDDPAPCWPLGYDGGPGWFTGCEARDPLLFTCE